LVRLLGLRGRLILRFVALSEDLASFPGQVVDAKGVVKGLFNYLRRG